MSNSSWLAGEVERRTLVRLLVFDLIVSPPVIAIVLSLTELGDGVGVVALMVVATCMRVLAWIVYLHGHLDPVRVWCASEHGDDATLLAAEASLQQLPTRCSSGYGAGWLAVCLLAIGVAYFGVFELMWIGRGELLSALMLTLGWQWIAALIVYPLTKIAADAARIELLAEVRARALEPKLRERSLTSRLRSQGMLMVLTPLLVSAALAWHVELDATRTAATLDATTRVDARARALDEGDTLAPGDTILPAAAMPARAEVDVRRELVRASARLDDGRWLVVEQPVSLTRGSFWLPLLGLGVFMIAWGFYAISGFARSMTAPIQRLSRSIHRVVDVGDVSEIEPLLVLDADDLGLLIRDFNRLLATQQRLAVAVAVLARGQLTVEFEGHGELAETFRGMVERMHELISRIHASAQLLATTATEMLAAVREQELGAEQHSANMLELRRLMESLARASVDNHATVGGVLENAEATLATSDGMVAKIAELETRTRGIGELLEIIREVADRSDILALNGALEATRAGEAGRGFALVAAEMRRLAERVTGTVVDVGELVAGIANASASTVTATEHSRALAHGTAEAARTIAEASKRQREDTESIAHGIAEIAELLERGSVATTQTRTAAQELGRQARELEDLIRVFELRESGQR